MIHDNYDPERDAADIKHLVIGLIMGLIACALITMCTGCTTTQYVPVIEHKTDTVYQNKVKHDSIWQHDSVQIMIKGDSVTIDRWHTKYVSKEVHDTTYISKTDSVPVPYPVEKLVPAELTWWQQTRLHIANIALWALLIAVVVWVGKRHIKKLLP